MSMNKKIFLRRINAYISFINTPNSHIPTTNLSISLSKHGILYPPIEILDEMFNSASNLLQDPASIVQCLGSEGYLTKSESSPSQPHHIKLNRNGSFARDTSCTKFKSYRICSHSNAVAEKEKYLQKPLWFLRSNQAKFSDLVNADVPKNTGKKRQKSTQRRKGTKQVKENPVMCCSGSNTNKVSLVNSCESDTIASAASSSQTNQTEGFDTFIARKVNPRPDSENVTNY